MNSSLRNIIVIAFLLTVVSLSTSYSSKEHSSANMNPQPTVKIIFDTDISGDHDDVGAVAVLHSLANSGEAEILAMAVAETGEAAHWGAECLDAINTFYGRPDIPIGVPSKGFAFNDIVYSRQIANEFPHELDTAWDATVLYRKILSQQPDTSVVIVTVGYMTNIAQLLQSKPDAFSALNGSELVNKKVKKWVCMGGNFPEGGEECNATSDAPTTKYAIDNWPRPILFCGYKIGAKINSGKRLPYLQTPNPVQRAFEVATCLGCCNTSFDQAAVLTAVRNPELYWDMVDQGYCSMSNDPEIGNRWHTSSNKNHAYLVEKVPSRQMEDIIEDLMMDLPNKEKQSFFTLPLDNTIRPVQGTAFTYRLPYYTYSKGDIVIKYKNLPDWISFENDSIFGLVPSSTGETSYEFQAILFDNGLVADTVNISISILKSPMLISDIQLASNACISFRVAKIRKGDNLYPDRPYRLKSIPENYLNYIWLISPANDGHRYDLGDSFITFAANNDVSIFIGYDKNYLHLMPGWLQEWTDTKDEINDDFGNSFHIFQKDFPKGKVVLGNNTTETQPLRLMYLILVKKLS